jgi:4-amino-4-deoxy-L-arabinose transferase-like glycosyltransferase
MIQKTQIRKILSDIRFWVFLFFLIRLIGITNPPLESAHNWRQTTVTMVARNFLETSNNIFYPRIDIAGEKTGITGMEFPLLNYLIYFVSEIFGYQHWYGRLINLLVSSFGLYYFHQLLRKYFTKETAFYASLILITSIWFAYSRKIMPDTFSTSFIIISLYCGTNYLENNTKKWRLSQLLGYAVFLLMGSLSKLPAAYMIVVLSLFYVDNNLSLKRKIIVAVITVLSLIPTAIWYFYWVPHLVENYGFWHFFMGKDFSIGIQEIWQNLSQTLDKFYEAALKYIGFFVFLIGIIYAFIKKDKVIISVLTICFLAFCVIIFKAGFTFSHHSYYIIPFVPVMSLLAGYGLASFKNKKMAFILLAFIILEGVLNQLHDFRINENEMKIAHLDQQLNQVCSKSDLILINSNDTPTPMYFSHRKGWVNSNEKINDSTYVNQLKNKGLNYILILKQAFGTEIQLSYPITMNNEVFCLYKI